MTSTPKEMTEEERIDLARVLSAFRGSRHYKGIIDFLEGEACIGQGPFDAAKFDPYRAAYIEGMQAIVKILKIESETARIYV
jgi:hypothetical protein